jgi:hypothetical protein
MVCDHRPETRLRSSLYDCLAQRKQRSMPVQNKHAGMLLVFFDTDVGNRDEIVHI